MQASKIVPGEDYAIRQTGKLVRFRVSKVSTERHKDSSTSLVFGYVAEDQVDGEASAAIQLRPEKILGPMKDFDELKQKEQEERAAQAAREKEESENADDLIRKFYALSGLAMPNDLHSMHSHPFYPAGYGGRIEIDAKGVRALLAAMKKMA